MADGDGGGGNAMLGVIVGALLIGVVVIGGFMFLGHGGAPSAPGVHISASVPGK
ncbi:MAG: hypothetical protein JO348_00460 [Alphaproteobacteria bacterium]|nr:hypothetical protein [Alphaproteobacteria bacterium]MBV9418217.1 hypothetical protein [Alphaproteobacteria bacterium]MBV9541987.1 hypothetical protein [Alphaproteobacteria bacterium]